MSIRTFVLASLVKLVQLIQEDRGVEFAVVPIAESLYALVNCVLAPVVKEVSNFACLVHGLDDDFDCFRFFG